MLDPAHALAAWLRLVPGKWHERMLALCINHLLRGQALRPRLAELRGKRFCVCAHDVPIALTFEVCERGLTRSLQPPDVTFRGMLADFIAVARRREDPDTLFFQRRLSVEGETETGLHLKNLLDGWEYDVPAHLHAVLPIPLARATIGATGAMRAAHELFQLRRPNSHRSSRRARNSRGD